MSRFVFVPVLAYFCQKSEILTRSSSFSLHLADIGGLGASVGAQRMEDVEGNRDPNAGANAR
jgi:hypothetical protein